MTVQNSRSLIQLGEDMAILSARDHLALKEGIKPSKKRSTGSKQAPVSVGSCCLGTRSWREKVGDMQLYYI